MTCDALIIGAGFGGLATALSLAERGLRVRLHEALAYPGGCASTFSRRGLRLDAGATLSCGVGPDELFGRWIHRYGLPLQVERPALPFVLRGPDGDQPLWADRSRTCEDLASHPDAPPGVRAFFAEVAAVGDALWPALRDPDLLPPLSLRAVVHHLRHAPALLRVLRVLGRTPADVARRHGVADFAPLRRVVDALCRVTVQGSWDEVEATIALPALDYPWRGAAHVHGGVGALAWALWEAARAAGADARLADRVLHVERHGDGWRAETRSGTILARHLVANLLPVDAARLCGLPDDAVARWQGPVDDAWGAVMLYRQVADLPALPRSSAHWMCIDRDGEPLTRGNHVFVSLSSPEETERTPPGTRVVTASTHLALSELRGADDPAALVAALQARMRQTLARRAPEIEQPLVEWTASPRTFQRFVRRSAVGGPIRRRWRALLHLGPVQLDPGLWLVGDSVFPGQGTLAVAAGGTRVAEAIVRRFARSG